MTSLICLLLSLMFNFVHLNSTFLVQETASKKRTGRINLTNTWLALLHKQYISKIKHNSPDSYFHICNILKAILVFLLCAKEDLYNPLLLFWHFRVRINTTNYNVWILCVIIKNFKCSNITHIVGNNNTRMLLWASWHCYYRFGASISWLVPAFFVLRCNHMFVNLFIPVFGAHSITCSQLQGVARIIFRYEVCDI